MQTIPDAGAVQRLIAVLDMHSAAATECLAYLFDIVRRAPLFALFGSRLVGSRAMVRNLSRPCETASQTVGP